VSDHDDRSVVVGERTRAALEQEKANTLRTIKELEFDRAMGKMSEEDFTEMSVRLRARAGRLIKLAGCRLGLPLENRGRPAKRRLGRHQGGAGTRAACVPEVLHLERHRRALRKNCGGALA
jgi:hypothetical protein